MPEREADELTCPETYGWQWTLKLVPLQNAEARRRGREGGKNVERWMDRWIESRKRNGTMMDGWMDGWMDGPKKWMGDRKSVV